jgi:hypothetical protein
MLFFIFLVSIAYGNSGPFIGGIDRGMDLIPTPHGWRPSKCVIRHDSYDVHLDYNETGTIAHYRDTGKTKFFPADPDCIENAKELFGDGNLKAWDVDASYSPPSHVGKFNATYEIPNQTPPCNGGCLLYWFIGFQNNDGSGPGVTIVQPVVNYQNGRWVMEPWNCCPSGQSNTGKQIAVGPGYKNIGAWVDAQGPGKNVAIGLSYGSQQSVLTVPDINRNFNWACVTLEEYGATCAAYPSQPFIFGHMTMSTLTGQNLSPTWRANKGQCNGGAKIIGPSEVDIYGKDMP